MNSTKLFPTLSLATFALSGVLPTSAPAATITSWVTGYGGYVCSESGQIISTSFNNRITTTTSLQSSTGEAVSASGNDCSIDAREASASSSASASADGSTGELKIKAATKSINSVVGASAAAEITEEFILNGTGTFTVLMLVDASWGFVSSGYFYATILVHDNSGGGIEQFAAAVDNGAPLVGSVDSLLLSYSRDFEDAIGDRSYVTWSLAADLVADSVSEMVDASNTGTLFFQTSGSLTATPATAGFLSDPSFPGINPAPVPLPAGLPLILSGVAAMLGLRKVARRRD